jgi:arabinogalactan oligomer / maltooligosaccharide transport system permease protein
MTENIFRLLRKMFAYTILIIGSIFVIVPILWIILASFSSGNSLYNSEIFTQRPSLIHYKELFGKTDFGLWYLNTLKIATLNMILSVILTMGSAYVFSRFRFPGRKVALSTIMILQMFPSVMSMVAVFVLLKTLGLIDTHLGLVLVYAGGQIPYNTWLVKGYLDSIPRSMDEAAKIDGAPNITIFVKIMLPIAQPIATYVALTNFIMPWMDFIFPQLVLRSQEKKTLAMSLYSLVAGQQNTEFTTFAAGAVLVVIPITVVFIFLQKYIVEGLSAGSSKC